MKLYNTIINPNNQLSDMKKALLYQNIYPGKIQCTACSWYCNISNNQFGICKTRYNKNGQLYSLVYGRPTGLAIDPIEKKPLYHLKPGSRLLSFGTVGCNFGCLFCQNDWMSQCNKSLPSKENEFKQIQSIIDKFSTKISPQKIVDLAIEYQTDGIAYTYNEPSIFAEFAYDTAKIAHKKGLINIFVSNGYESQESYKLLVPLLDGINIDLKSINDKFYQSICKAKLKPVQNNITNFYNSGIVTEVTTLIIPGKNDSKNELCEIAKFLAAISKDIPWHLNAFYPAYKMDNIESTPVTTLIKAYNIGKSEGLNYVYIGNIIDNNKSSTYCPSCGICLIERRNYIIIQNNIRNNKCQKCQTNIYGTWNI